jgi:hypothetical protein
VNDNARKVLDGIKKRKGKLLAADIVDTARDEDSPLHRYFDWDDSSAAEKYRLWQARQLIVTVHLLNDGLSGPTQMYYSLGADRRAGGGYRDVRDIIASDELRDELILTASRELAAFKERYQRVKRDLAEVFEAIDHLEERVTKKAKAVSRKPEAIAAA